MAKNNFSHNRLLLQQSNMDPSVRFRIEEAYKTIRTNIMFSIMKKGCKTVVVSSCAPGEGKTTTAINIAISLAEADQKVLIVDGDLRKPRLHHYFGVPNAPGLTNYIGDAINAIGKKTDLFSVIHPTEFKNLSILCSGSIPPNPAELLGSEPMVEFLQKVSIDYDYIIIDTPPINIVSDALPVIREADGVVLVVRSRQSTYPDVDKAVESLQFINAKILGFVVNFTQDKGSRYGKSKYSGYGYGYGYGSNLGKKKKQNDYDKYAY